MHAEMLISGHRIGGPCDQSVGKTVARSPWDGSVVGTAAEGGLNEANTALAAAHEAYAGWRRTEIAERQRILRRVAELVRERSEELAELAVQEIGKPIGWARAEVGRLALTFELAARELDDFGPEPFDLGYDPRGSSYEGHAQRVPRGVVLAIVPYNWPYNLTAHKLAPALAVGNTVVVKVSPKAPLCTLELCHLVHEAGLPDGVLNAVHVPNPIAARMVQDARVAMVSFTGSAEVGWTIREKVVDRPVTLELGGDAFCLVEPDADLDWAAERIATSAFGYAGQVCISAQHALVHQSVAAAFRERLRDAVWRLGVGNPADEGTVCGPLIDLEAAERVREWVAEAESAGARRLVGESGVGTLVPPTVLEDVPETVRLGCQEVFGPVLTLGTYAGFQEALARVNRSRYGIHASLFTRSDARVEEAWSALEVGGLVVNDFPTLRFDSMPYGGEKRSGFGREGVAEAMREMTSPRTRVRRV